MPILVSVIIPTYKRPQLVKQALASVLTQTYKSLEVIIVEDGSGSDLPVYLAGLNDPRLRYHRHEQQQGLSAARNTGIRLAQGEYVAFLDDDDEWLPAKIEKQVAGMLENGGDKDARLVYCGMTTIRRQSGEILLESRPQTRGDMRSFIYHGGLLPQSSLLLSRQALQTIGGFSEDLASCIDHDIWLKMARAGFVMEAVAEPLIKTYIGEEEQRMTSKLDQRLHGMKQFFDKWRAIVIEAEGLAAWQKNEATYYGQFTSRVLQQMYAKKITKQEAVAFLRAFSDIQTSSISRIDATLVSLQLDRLVPSGTFAQRQRSRLYRFYKRSRASR